MQVRNVKTHIECSVSFKGLECIVIKTGKFNNNGDDNVKNRKV
jgi:hypothetical protein